MVTMCLLYIQPTPTALKSAVAEKGTVEDLVRKLWSDDAEIQASAAGALKNLATNNGTCT